MRTRPIRCLVAFCVSLIAALAYGSVGRPTTALNLRAKPSTTSKVLAVLQPHDTVEIHEARKGWYSVRVSSSGKTGWVSRKFVMVTDWPANEHAETAEQRREPTHMPSMPMQKNTHHSTIRIHRAVLKAFEGLARSLSADGIPFEPIGDEYDAPVKLVGVFGRGASIADLRAVINATGPSADLYLSAVDDDDFANTIMLGPHGGDGYKRAKLKDVYDALQGASDIDELASEIAKKGKRQP